MEIEALDHVAARDEEQKGLTRRSTLQLDERIDRIAVDSAAKSVDRLCRIGEDPSHLHVRKREARR